MQVRTYGLYDGVAQEYVRTFTAKSDDMARRACKYIVREPNFDAIAGKDYTVAYLYTMDSENGVIIDNTILTVCTLASEIDAYEIEKIKQSQLKEVVSEGK